MATLRSDTISGIGTEGPVLNGGLHFRSENYLTLPKGDTTQRGGTLGIFGGGYTASGIVSPGPIDFILIQSQGNAVDFGELSVARQLAGTASSKIRGLFGGGNVPSLSDVIDFVIFSTQSNATDFGNSCSGFGAKPGGRAHAEPGEAC